MGTPMAPNFANLFMSKFETDMLNAYEKEFQKRPLRWYRFIDDVFFVWTYDKTSLIHFIDFCNSYATRSKLRSSIRFTSEFSKSSVSFLDMIVRLENGRICTSVYSKPVDTHTYLHSTSFHSPSTIISLPKTQFIRIRRICSSIADFNLHASKFVEFFVRRGYKKSKLLLTVDEVAKMSREDLLASKPAVSFAEFPKRTVLSVLWHPRLQFLQRALHGTYKRFSTKYPSLKKTFPEPPLVAYRKNPTLSNSLVRARYGPKTVPDQFTLPATSTRLQKNMSTATSLTNTKSGITVPTICGHAKMSNVVYAARCKRCDIIYVGYTTNQLNNRFSGHRSDVSCHPDRSELPKHFKDSPSCDFDRDLEVHILQRNISGSRAIMEAHEDRWILRLNTMSPNGLNSKFSEQGVIFNKLFK